MSPAATPAALLAARFIPTSAPTGAAPAEQPAGPPQWADAVASVQNDPTPAWWDQEAMQQASDDDMDTLRQNTISKFFQEPPVPRIQIPPEIDQLVNRYLSML